MHQTLVIIKLEVNSTYNAATGLLINLHILLYLQLLLGGVSWQGAERRVQLLGHFGHTAQRVRMDVGSLSAQRKPQ